jgi:hypothetical protein
MKSHRLCLERLYRIRAVLERLGGKATLRGLVRTFAFVEWEILQAAEIGAIKVTIVKPQGRGRPSRIVELCDWENVKLPLPRRQIEPVISNRHHLFARLAALQCCHRGMLAYGVPSDSEAYRIVYNSRSMAVAHAGACRLMKRRDVRAAWHWFKAQLSGEIPRGTPMP